MSELIDRQDAISVLKESHKFKYTLNGISYFIILTWEEKPKFEARYGVWLELWD